MTVRSRWEVMGLMCVTAAACAAGPVERYVSPQGRDAWSGTAPAPGAAAADGPFATLARARDEIRRLKAAGELRGGATVFVRGGTWLAQILAGPVDQKGVDGAVGGLAGLVERTGEGLRRLQTGTVRSYAFSMLLGAILAWARSFGLFGTGAVIGLSCWLTSAISMQALTMLRTSIGETGFMESAAIRLGTDETDMTQSLQLASDCSREDTFLVHCNESVDITNS